MKRLYRLSLGLFFICLSIILVTGCYPGSANETIQSEEESESNGVQNLQNATGETDDDCDEIKSELESLRSKYDELTSDYAELNTKHSELNAEYSELVLEYGKLDREHRELKVDYDELNVKYHDAIQATADIIEEDIEQAIFTLINEDRSNISLSELEWTDSLHRWAKEHSNYMAQYQVVELSDSNYWQAVSLTSGHATADQVAIGTLRVWKEEAAYANSLLNEHANFGAVAVTRTGDVYYITFFSFTEK